MESLELTNETPWFAIQVRTTHENRVTTLLDYQGHEYFSPVYQARRRWSDRIKQMDIPLFPGYVFCRFPLSARKSILRTPSVLRILGIGSVPTPMDDQEIKALQTVVQARAGVLPHPFLQTGQLVRIEDGPLYGLEGIIVDARRAPRLVLSVKLLQRSVAVEIDSACVRRIYFESKPPQLTLCRALTPVGGATGTVSIRDRAGNG